MDTSVATSFGVPRRTAPPAPQYRPSARLDARIADGAQQDGVGLLDALLFLFRKNRAVTQIALGTQIELLIFEFGDAFGRLLQSLLSPRSHFLANAIARNDGDGVLLCRITHSSRL